MKRASQSPLATPAIDEIWRRAATTIGFTLSRTQDAYATSDGRGEIAIGAKDTLDGDDALAQLVFHELCHAITEGEASLRQPDWGLDNVPEHVAREHACLRVQARVSDRFGLRAAMAPTTPYRDYYAALPADPLQGAAGDEDAALRAAAACARFDASRGARRSSRRCRRQRLRLQARKATAPRGAPARFRARTGGRDVRYVRLGLRRRSRRRGHALPAERARQR